MNKVSTLFYEINDFENTQATLLSIDDVFDGFIEFKDVMKLLDRIEFEPPQRIIDSIIAYSKC